MSFGGPAGASASGSPVDRAGLGVPEPVSIYEIKRYVCESSRQCIIPGSRKDSELRPKRRRFRNERRCPAPPARVVSRLFNFRAVYHRRLGSNARGLRARCSRQGRCRGDTVIACASSGSFSHWPRAAASWFMTRAATSSTPESASSTPSGSPPRPASGRRTRTSALATREKPYRPTWAVSLGGPRSTPSDAWSHGAIRGADASGVQTRRLE